MGQHRFMFRTKSEHVFISYDHDNKETAQKLEQCLGQAGIKVWWDERLQAGQKWAQEIDKALLSASAVIVLWSKESIESEWVKHEASIAMIQNVLTHVSIGQVMAPGVFGSIQCTDLSSWKGAKDDPAFQRLVEGIKSTRRNNKVREWKRIFTIAMTTLIITSLLIFGGYLLRKYLTRPGHEIALWWKPSTENIQIMLDINKIRQFYNPEKWNLAFLCREFKSNDKGIDDPYDINSTFAAIPLHRTSEQLSININYQPDMADNLGPINYVACDVSVIATELGLSSLSPLTESGYAGTKWPPDGATTIQFTEAVNIFREHRMVTLKSDICSCAPDYQTQDSLPPNAIN